MNRNPCQSLVQKTAALWVVTALLCSGGCTLLERSTPDPIYTDAWAMVGHKVIKRGLVHFRFEDRALYQERSFGKDRDEDLCLPILVEESNDVMTARMRAIDGKVATLSGKIISLVEPGMDVVGGCRKYGLVVETIDGT